MEASIKLQLLNILDSMGLGVIIGIIYELFGIFRVLLGLETIQCKIYSKVASKNLSLIDNKGTKDKEKNKRKMNSFKYFIIDIIFFVVITPIFLIFFYATSNGIIRWYICFGVFVGYFVYYLTLRKLINPFIHFIFSLFYIIVRHICFIIKFPFVKLSKILSKKLLNFKIKLKSLKKVINKKILKQKALNNKAIKEKHVLITYAKTK